MRKIFRILQRFRILMKMDNNSGIISYDDLDEAQGQTVSERNVFQNEAQVRLSEIKKYVK